MSRRTSSRIPGFYKLDLDSRRARVASVFADGLGLGSSPGLGPGQVVGVAAGFVVAVLGFMGATSR